MSERAAKTDYAVCAGHRNIDAYPGPVNMMAMHLRGYRRPAFPRMTGIAFVLSKVRADNVYDGLSNTCMVGEKYLSVASYHDGRSLGDDQSMYIGDDADIRRWTSAPPVPDGARTDDIEHFGGPHSGGCQFVFADGSVRLVSFTVNRALFRHLGNRHDGIAIDHDQL